MTSWFVGLKDTTTIMLYVLTCSWFLLASAVRTDTSCFNFNTNSSLQRSSQREEETREEEEEEDESMNILKRG